MTNQSASFVRQDRNFRIADISAPLSVHCPLLTGRGFASADDWWRLLRFRGGDLAGFDEEGVEAGVAVEGIEFRVVSYQYGVAVPMIDRLPKILERGIAMTGGGGSAGKGLPGRAQQGLRLVAIASQLDDLAELFL